MRERNAVVLIFAALLLREMFILFPSDPGTFDPFPFYDIQISIQSYAYFAFYYIAMCTLAYAFLWVMPAYHTLFTVWFFLQIGELIDYFLTYNSPWFHFWIIPVGITLVKFVVLGIIIVTTWTKR